MFHSKCHACACWSCCSKIIVHMTLFCHKKWGPTCTYYCSSFQCGFSLWTVDTWDHVDLGQGVVVLDGLFNALWGCFVHKVDLRFLSFSDRKFWAYCSMQEGHGRVKEFPIKESGKNTPQEQLSHEDVLDNCHKRVSKEFLTNMSNNCHAVLHDKDVFTGFQTNKPDLFLMGPIQWQRLGYQMPNVGQGMQFGEKYRKRQWRNNLWKVNPLFGIQMKETSFSGGAWCRKLLHGDKGEEESDGNPTKWVLAMWHCKTLWTLLTFTQELSTCT